MIAVKDWLRWSILLEAKWEDWKKTRVDLHGYG